MRELRKKLLRKWQARDRGEETGSDDDDDDDEVAADVDWDVLEDEDMLTDAHRPCRGPSPSMRREASPQGRWEPEDLPPHPGCRRRIGGWGEADRPPPLRC